MEPEIVISRDRKSSTAPDFDWLGLSTGSGSMHYPCSGPRDIRSESVEPII